MEADALSRAPFIRPTVDARQNRAALMYETAASTVLADGNPTVHFLTVEEVEPANNFYQATTCFWRASLRLGCKLSPHAPSCSPLARYICNNCLMLRAALGGDDTIVVPASATHALFDEFHQHHSGVAFRSYCRCYTTGRC